MFEVLKRFSEYSSNARRCSPSALARYALYLRDGVT